MRAWSPRSRSVVMFVFLVSASLLFGGPMAADAAGPEGQLTWGVHVSLAPAWFDPAEAPGILTPFMLLYALHDARAKPIPGNAMAPRLAPAWTASPHRPP